MQFTVILNQFTLQLKALNAMCDSDIHSCGQVSSGTYGTVYRAKFREKFYAVKCIRLDRDSLNYTKTLTKAIKEFCFLKICSILKLGPKVTNAFGFDLILYENCIEFDC